MSNKPAIIALTAPSGSGKTSIARRLLAAIPGLHFSVSATTRPPRGGETDGVEYHFLTPDAFRARVEAGDLLEYEEVYPDRFYGTLRAEVDQSSPAEPVLLDIDVLGAGNVKAQYGERALVLFVRPPSVEALAERLRARQTESEADLAIRLERVRYELTFADRFDVVVVNDDLDRAANETIALVQSFLAGLSDESPRGASHEA